MNQPWVYMCPHPEPLSLLPPCPILQGHPSASALSTLSHTLNLDRQSISCMVIYMFQCCCHKSSHTCLLPQSPKVCSLHLCLLLSCIKDHHYHLSKFHIYELIHSIGVLLWFTSLCTIGSSFIHLIKTDSNAFFLMAE